MANVIVLTRESGFITTEDKKQIKSLPNQIINLAVAGSVSSLPIGSGRRALTVGNSLFHSFNVN